MIKLQTQLALIFILLAFSTASFALSVGDKQLNSTLNQKLDARVELLNVRRGEMATMNVSLAPSLIYQQMGVDKTPLLENLSFTLQRTKSGQHFIHITSDFIVSKPFFTFLVELNWNDGRLLREFTLFMDPPIFLDENLDALDISAPAQVELLAQFGGATTNDDYEADLIEAGLLAKKSVLTVSSDLAEDKIVVVQKKSPKPIGIATATTTEKVVKLKPVQISAPVEKPVSVNDAAANTFIIKAAETNTQVIKPELAKAKPKAVKAEPVKAKIIKKVPVKAVPKSLVYKVKKNDVLWRIAVNMRPSNVTVEQMMLALQKENPKSILPGNLSTLEIGSVLRIKDISKLTATSPEEAKLEVARQHSEWLASKSVEEVVVATAVKVNAPAVVKEEEVKAVEVVKIKLKAAKLELAKSEIVKTAVKEPEIKVAVEPKVEAAKLPVLQVASVDVDAQLTARTGLQLVEVVEKSVVTEIIAAAETLETVKTVDSIFSTGLAAIKVTIPLMGFESQVQTEVVDSTVQKLAETNVVSVDKAQPADVAMMMTKPVELIDLITKEFLVANKGLIGLVLLALLLLILLSASLINMIFYRKHFAQKPLVNPLEKQASLKKINSTNQTTVVQFDEVARKHLEADLEIEVNSHENKQSSAVNS